VNKFEAREGTMENGRSILSLILKVLAIIVFAAGWCSSCCWLWCLRHVAGIPLIHV